MQVEEIGAGEGGVCGVVGGGGIITVGTVTTKKFGLFTNTVTSMVGELEGGGSGLDMVMMDRGVCCTFLSRRATEGWGVVLIGVRAVWSMGSTVSVNVSVVLGLEITPKGGG